MHYDPDENPLFVTVGTSALNNELIGTVGDVDNSRLREDVRKYREDRSRVGEYKRKRDRAGGPGGLGRETGETGRWQPLFDRLLAEHRRYWAAAEEADYVDNEIHFKESAAEAVSTLAMGRALERHGQDPGIGGVVLLASDSCEGFFCGKLLRAILADDGFRRHMKWIENPPPVSLHVVPDLDAGRTNVIGQMREAIERNRKAVDPFRINMTGGYKGTAAALGYLAGQAPERYHLFYLHESEEQAEFWISEEGEASGEPGGVW